MQHVFELVRRVAETKGNVLITGKSGTGKELVAKAIHYHSARKDKMFLPVNCGAIAESLIESELFGHKRGAFTGAVEDTEGMFQLANGGTLFLDEISEIPLHLQVKLLRVIEEKEVRAVGSAKPVKVDVRIIAASNQDLASLVKEGKFREDLFYRLNVVEIKLPPLSERREDIPLLVNHFISKYSKEMSRHIKGVDNETMKLLMSYEWKGNVRELENVIERAVIFANDDYITVKDLPPNIRTSEDLFVNNIPDDLKDAVHVYERRHILYVLRKYNFDKGRAAEALSIGLSSLYRKIDELELPLREGAD
jgi:transcriptional regulator with PAS, ATPase and Fis domain